MKKASDQGLPAGSEIKLDLNTGGYSNKSKILITDIDSKNTLASSNV